MDQDKRVKATHNTSNNNPSSKLKRTNELTSQTDEDQILKQILGTEVPLTVRNILGISKKLRQNLNGQMKDQVIPTEREEARVHFVSSQDTGQVTKASAVESDIEYSQTPAPSDRRRMGYSPLLEFDIQWNDKTIRAILDTGSEMNIVSSDVIDRIQPKEPRRVNSGVSMAGANNEITKLDAHYDDIRLTIGDKVTYTSLYVMHKPKFELILGRPWQLEHKVNIEERSNGTWLSMEHDMPGERLEIFLGPPNNFIPFRTHGYLARASSNQDGKSLDKILLPSHEFYLNLDGDSDYNRITDCPPTHTFRTTLSTDLHGNQHNKFIPKCTVRAIKSIDRLDRTRNYLYGHYSNLDPSFKACET